MVGGKPSQAERIVARSMLTMREEESRRRAWRWRLVSGILTLGSMAAFVGFALAGWVAALAFLTGAVGGGATYIWILSTNAEARRSVALQVCDWERVERLANGVLDGPPCVPSDLNEK